MFLGSSTLLDSSFHFNPGKMMAKLPKPNWSKFAAVLVAFRLLFPGNISAYSVLTHEAIIDSAWKANIVPLLRARFPGITDEDLLKAKSYAYGGSIIQDMGYYPYGSKLFSDLTHYFRSGDFV